MPAHKAGRQFFDKKRQWSERKDLILDYYLQPYLAKIATLRAPILLVDAFAGPGEFGDGAAGSPLIFVRHAEARLAARPDLSLKLVCIEADEELHRRLAQQLEGLPFAEAYHGEFVDFVPRIERWAAHASTFLYLDPYTIDGLDWQTLERLFQFLAQRRSVEILLNFNATIFVRLGRQALKLAPPAEGPTGGIESSAHLPVESSSVDRLNSSVGGDWWKPVLDREVPFPTMVDDIVRGLEERFHRYFKEVCVHPVLELPHHSVPKYHLIFASRHPDGLRLMTNAMRKSQDRLARLAQTNQRTLFETRPKRLVPDLADLEGLILRLIDQPMPRGAAIEQVMRSGLNYSETEIRRAITSLLKAGKLSSASGRTKVNDREDIFPADNAEA